MGELKKCIVINLFAGPGAGKSLLAARIFSDLKLNGINAELVTEYAKRKVWEKSFRTLENQIYMFGKQQHSMWICSNQVDVIVTDSPLLLTMAYNDDKLLHKLAKACSHNYNNINIYVGRISKYQQVGRMQTLSEAEALDKKIYEIVTYDEGIDISFELNMDNYDKMFSEIISHINYYNKDNNES